MTMLACEPSAVYPIAINFGRSTVNWLQPHERRRRKSVWALGWSRYEPDVSGLGFVPTPLVSRYAK
jgi:hypothetical protein